MANTSQNQITIPFARPMLGEAEKALVAEVLSGHVLTHGPRNAEFEKRFAQLLGVKHAMTTSSCTTALHLALIARNIGPGDEVIVPAQTHVATAHVVEHVGAKPIFVDVDRRTGNIGADGISRAISARTRAIMVVHFLGLPCDMDAINAVASRRKLSVIEDCALALGAHYGDRRPGGLGDAGCFSFYPAKHITTLEGGMFTTNDDELADLARKKRAFGYDKGLDERTEPGVYDVTMLGHNFRMSEVQAAVGLCQLDRLDGFLAARRRNTSRLLAEIADVEELTTFPIESGKAKSACFCVNVMLPDNDKYERRLIVEQLMAAGIGTSVHYPVPVPLSRYYKSKYGGTAEDFPVARWISAKTISLPVGPHLDEDQMIFIATQLKQALHKYRVRG